MLRMLNAFAAGIVFSIKERPVFDIKSTHQRVLNENND